MTTRRNIATPSGGPRYAIVPPLVHLHGAPCYQFLPGDGGVVPDLDGAARDYERCPVCFPTPEPEKPAYAGATSDKPKKKRTKKGV